MKKSRKPLHPNAPLKHPDHPRPITRRDFVRQGFLSGAGVIMGGSLLSLLTSPRLARAALSNDLQDLAGSLSLSGVDCNINRTSAGLPFICFDLAGGANIAGSNVLVGRDSQLDVLSTAGYSKLGLPGDQIPGLPETNPTATSKGDHTDTTLGLAFHSDSAMLRGILEKAGAAVGNINGAVIPARSDNDTGNNPHNPMYGIAKAGAEGSVVTLIGSRNSDSGGNSMAPASLIDPTIRPTKVDRPSDVTGMIDTGNLKQFLDADAILPVMESAARISNRKMARVSTGLSAADDAMAKDLVRCGYLGAASTADRFALAAPDPAADTRIVGPSGIFSDAEFNSGGDRGEFQKTASVMKMVLDGYAGAGTITMGGYDYHTGDRSTGELRDLRAGRCIGACLAYAAVMGQPLMIYVCSDGSLASNGMIDNSVNGRGKGVWTGDNSSTAASFFLVYNPGTPPQIINDGFVTQLQRQQIGWFRADGSVDTASSPAANNVNLLVNTVLLNYMALNGNRAAFESLFPGHGLGNTTSVDNLVVFEPLA